VLSCSKRPALPARGRLERAKAGQGAARCQVRSARPGTRACGAQVGSRAERMGLAGAGSVFLYSATRLEDILREVVAMRPRAVIVDSIQTVYLDDVAGSAGSVSQARAPPRARAPPGARRARGPARPARPGPRAARTGRGASAPPKSLFFFFWGGGW